MDAWGREEYISNKIIQKMVLNIRAKQLQVFSGIVGWNGISSVIHFSYKDKGKEVWMLPILIWACWFPMIVGSNSVCLVKRIQLFYKFYKLDGI
jgi:hypothetical protein